jgi:hypothetical protein
MRQTIQQCLLGICIVFARRRLVLYQGASVKLVPLEWCTGNDPWTHCAYRYQGKLNIAEVDCQHAGQSMRFPQLHTDLCRARLTPMSPCSPDTCMRFGIRSYPSIKLYVRKGSICSSHTYARMIAALAPSQ